MKPWQSAGLALAALLGGGWLLGWQGVILAMTLIVFWLSVEIARLMRLMKRVSAAPLSQVASAVMLHSQLRVGMKLAVVLDLAGSLGAKLDGPGKAYVWRDAGGDRVEARFENGRLANWQLLRAEATEPPGSPGAAPP